MQGRGREASLADAVGGAVSGEAPSAGRSGMMLRKPLGSAQIVFFATVKKDEVASDFPEGLKS